MNVKSDKSGPGGSGKYVFESPSQGEQVAKPPAPPANPVEPAPPPDVQHAIPAGIQSANAPAQAMNSAVGTAASVTGAIADPGAALAGALGGAADEKMSKLVSGMAG